MLELTVIDSSFALTNSSKSSMPPPPTLHHAEAMSELERERQTALFVIRNFLPPEQQAKVNLEFIMQQLRRSPIDPHFPIKTYSPGGETEFDENSEEWQDLMQWTNPTLLDMIESQPVHLFQWERTHRFIVNLRDGLMGFVPPTPELEMQKKQINVFMQHKAKLRADGTVTATGISNSIYSNSKNPMKVLWILWKLRGSLATIPRPSTRLAYDSANIRSSGVLADLGVPPFPKFKQWLIKNPDAVLLYLVALFWFPWSPAQPEPQVL